MYWLNRRLDILNILWCDIRLTLAFYKKTRAQTEYLAGAKDEKDLACRNETITAIERHIEVGI